MYFDGDSSLTSNFIFFGSVPKFKFMRFIFDYPALFYNFINVELIRYLFSSVFYDFPDAN